MPAQNATISATFGDGKELFVFAFKVGTSATDFSVSGKRTIAGVSVQSVTYPSGEVRSRFTCKGADYEAFGAVPPNYSGFDSFLVKFIGALGCS